jgi:hypothetical protein
VCIISGVICFIFQKKSKPQDVGISIKAGQGFHRQQADFSASNRGYAAQGHGVVRHNDWKSIHLLVH